MKINNSLYYPLLGEAEASPFAAAYLAEVKSRIGMVPNLYRLMANFPGILKSYIEVEENFRKHSLFDATEQEVVILTISVANNCAYCVAAHSVVADLNKVPKDITDAIRNGEELQDSKLQALRRFTEQLVAQRRWLNDEEIKLFLESGYSPNHVLNVLLALGLKTLSNCTNHLTNTPLDKGFAHREWQVTTPSR